MFVVVASLALMIGSSAEDDPEGPHPPFVSMAEGDTSALALETQLRGTFALEMGVFGLAIAIFGIRRFGPWAWQSMWVWPVFFVLHFIAFVS